MSTEFLDVGEDRRPRWSWRVRLLVLAVLVVLAAGAVVTEHKVRERTERAVARCADRANESIDLAGREVRAAYAYVRPSLFNPSPELQSGMARLFAGVAEGADAPLAEPRESCSQVWVLPLLHEDLQARRDRCVELLAAHESGLEAVSEDGRALDDWLDVPLRC